MKTQIFIEGLYKRVSASQRDFVTAQSNQATIRRPRKSLAAVTFGLLLSVPGRTQAQFRFTTIDVPGAIGTEVNGNSPFAIAGQVQDADGNPLHGFVLKNGSFTTIDVPNALEPGVSATEVDGINAPGQLVGTYFVGSTNHAFFENNGNFIKLDPANVKSQGGGINAKGQVSGTYRDNTQYRHGFIWRNGNFTTFNVPGDATPLGTVAFGINDIGEVVGDYVDASHGIRHGFLRSSDGLNFTTLDVPNAVLTVAEGINNRGTIVGVYLNDFVNFIRHGFVLNNGVFMKVDVPDAQQTEINSINAIGEIGGYYIDSTGVVHGFIGVPAQ
jgi:probable HAF family extracellular repeat protein